MPKTRRGESAEFALELPQVERVLKACNDIEDRLTVGVQIFCGLRAGELAHLQADWITTEGDLRVPSFQTCHCAECVRNRGGEWRPKTKAGARVLPIAPQIKKDLLKFLQTSPYGLNLTRGGIYYRTKTILKRAGIRFKGPADNTGFPHCLRATCAMILAQGGMEAMDLCYVMGWKNLSVANSYIQASRAKQSSAKKMKEIFGI